uniref:SART-1 protein n=1 Tax=Aplanochytrium stocchinoi TaxID=215587 RepID=A0A7S3PNI2_9STRA
MPGLNFKVKMQKGKNGEVSCSVEETNKIRAKLGLKPLREKNKRNTEQSKAKVIEKNGEISCSIEDTNRIRAQLGLKPLRVQQNKKNSDKIQVKSGSKPKVDADVEARIERARKKRKLKEKFISTKTLAESSEDLDTSEWIKRSKLKQNEALKALERAKEFEELESTHAKEAETYDSTQLGGIRISHHLKDLKPGEEVIMTLKDTSVLDEANNDLTGKVDELENVYIAEGERAKKRAKLQEKIQRSKKSYAGIEEEYDEDGKRMEKGILDKYDLEDNINQHKAAYVLNASGIVENAGKKKNQGDKNNAAFKSVEEPRISLLDAVNDNLFEASKEDYLTKQEIEASTTTKLKKEKKIKKKSKKNKRDKKGKKLRSLRSSAALNDMIDDAEAEDESSILLRKNNKKEHKIADEDEDEEPDDMGLQEALLKARRAVSQKRKGKSEEGANDHMIVDGPKINRNVFKTDYLGSSSESREFQGQIFTTATQFSSAIESRMEDTREEQQQQHNAAMEQKRSENVKIKAESASDNLQEQPISGSREPTILDSSKRIKTEEDSDNANVRELFKPKGSSLAAGGLAAALAAFRSQGDIKPSEEEKEALEKATEKIGIKKKKLDENTQFDIDLTYRDKNGKILSTKEAYVQMCYKFHGIKPGKNKLEKLKKREEQKKRMQNMNVGDTPLGTASALRKQTKKQGVAFITLDSNK